MVSMGLMRFHLFYNELTPIAFWGGFFCGLLCSLIIGLIVYLREGEK